MFIFVSFSFSFCTAQHTDSICLWPFHVFRNRMHKLDMDAATKTIRELHFFVILIYCILWWHGEISYLFSPSPYNYHVGIRNQMTARNQKGRRTHSCALHFLWIIASRSYVPWSLSIRCPSWLAGNGCLRSARNYCQIPSGAQKLAVSMSIIPGTVMPIIVLLIRWAQALLVPTLVPAADIILNLRLRRCMDACAASCWIDRCCFVHVVCILKRCRCFIFL